MKRRSVILCMLFIVCITVISCSSKNQNSQGDILDKEASELSDSSLSQDEEDISTGNESDLLESEDEMNSNHDSEVSEENQSIPQDDMLQLSDEKEEPENSIEELTEITKLNFLRSSDFQKKVLKRMEKKSVNTVYTKAYQKAAFKELQQLKKKEYTFDSPLLIENPFGTIENGMYFYYMSEEPCNVNYSVYVDHEAMQVFRAQLYSDDKNQPVTEHEGTLIGLIPGVKNYIVLEEVDANDVVVNEKVYCINLSNNEISGQMLYLQDYNELEQPEEFRQDFFMLFQNAEAENGNIVLIDHHGVRRLTLLTDEAVNMDLNKIDDYLIYPKDSKKIVVIDRLGHASYIYSLGNYRYENGLVYNPSNGLVYMTASDIQRESRSDLVLSLNLSNGEIKEVIDFTVELSELLQLEESFTTDTKHWIELNSIDLINDNKLLVSSKAMSSVFCISNLQENGVIDYIISDQSNWENTSHAKFLYQSIGSFEAFINPNSMQVYFGDKRLIDGQYYIVMYDANQRYYQVFVDENTQTFTLANKLEFDNALSRGSVYVYEDSLIYMIDAIDDVAIFGEYTKDEKDSTIYTIEEDAKDYLKVEKNNFSGIWFN